MTSQALVVVHQEATSAHGNGDYLRFWWQRTQVPLGLFALLAAIFATTNFDLDIARALFFNPANQRWIGADSWWTNDLIHSGGQFLLRSLAAAAAVIWIASYKKPGLIGYRRPAAFFVIAVVLSISFVGILKTVTNVHCPWALSDFGGAQPYLHLFSHRPASMRAGHCFPAAHSSSGYALIALFFLFRERSARLAKISLCVAAVTGLMFGIAQQSRGAHFVSHDIWSAFLVWMISLSIYTFAFKMRLWSQSA
jgi:membrane-associated PAP2 superfamily phosphatase